MKRVYELIESLGLNLEEVSRGTAIPIERLKQILNDQKAASIGQLRRLSSFLNVEINELVGEQDNLGEIRVLFRKSLSQIEQSQTSQQIDQAMKAIRVSHLLMNEEQGPLDWEDSFRGIEANTFENASFAASKVRELFFSNDQLSPITNLPQIVSEQMKINLYVVSGQEFEGASTVYKRKKFIFLGPRFPGRMLFTLAHELAHLLVHHSHDDFMAFDRDVYSTSSNSQSRIEEDFANAFASCLLMPEAGVGAALQSIRRKMGVVSNEVGDIEILYLCRFYGVSFYAAAIRCEQLGLLPVNGAHALDEKLRRAHGSAEERAKEIGMPMRPDIDFNSSNIQLLDSAIHKIKTEEFSIGKVSELLNLGFEKIYERHGSTLH